MRLRWLPFLGVSLVVSSAWGQTPNPGAIKEAEFVIEKEKKNELAESSRLFKKAILPTQFPQSSQNLKYEWIELSPTSDLLEHKVKLLKAKQDLLTKLYGNYVRLGYGKERNPYFSWYWTNADPGKYGYGLHLSHWSTGKERFLEIYHHTVQLQGTWATEQLSLAGEAYYHGDQYPLIKLGDPSHKNDPDRARTFHQLGAQASLSNYATDPLQYQIPVAFSHLRNRQGEQENKGEVGAKASYPLKENLLLEADINGEFSQYRYVPAKDAAGKDTSKDASEKNIQQNGPEKAQSLHVERLKPSLSFTFQDFRVQVGFSLVYQNKTTALIKRLNAYPLLEVNYAAWKWIRPYIGLGGDIQANSWHTLIAENPWLASQPALAPTNERFSFYGGVSGDVAPQLAFHAGAKVSSYQNLPFFVNQVDEPRQLTVEYDPETSLLNAFGELAHTNHTATLSTRLKGNYYAYKPKQLAKPWHKPSYELDLLSSYNLYNKIWLKGHIYCLGGIEARDPVTQAAKELKDMVDLGVGIDYLWNQRFTVFLNCENLLARSQPRYLNTSDRGFNVLLGVAYTW